MADEPLALSTIPPAPPVDADYDAVCQALMETGRGRWFLEEYARRNRNADTRLVLAAIARMEAAVRNEQAHHATSNILAAAERLQGAAWTMRERGLDMAMCDQIADLAAAILSASSLSDPNDARARKLGEVLRHLERRIDAMLDAAAEGAGPAAAERAADAAVPEPPGDPAPDRIVAERRVETGEIDIEPPVVVPVAARDADVQAWTQAIDLDPIPVAPARPAENDPLAALKAMSDEERLALFT